MSTKFLIMSSTTYFPCLPIGLPDITATNWKDFSLKFVEKNAPTKKKLSRFRYTNEII